jgi:two-component system, NarL family, response regulator NreC
MESVRILLADDHTLVRQGFRKILEDCEGWQIVAEAADGREAVRQAVELVPDIAIVDIAMPQLNGIEATRQIVRRVPSVRVLVLSMHVREIYVNQVVAAGARGYLLKDSAGADLLRAVTALSRGQSFFSQSVVKLMRDPTGGAEPRGGERYDLLSQREREVFQLIAEGRSTKEIATLLGVSTGTIETHRAHIMEKLDLHSAVEIALYAVRRGIIS